MSTPQGKAIDAAYLLAQFKGYDTNVASVKYNPMFQFASMPEASADNIGKYIQYIGATTSDYTNGYFYKSIAEAGAEGTTYKWEAVTQSAPTYSIKKLDNPSSTDYAATYRLTKDEVEVGDEINIPKDFFVTDATSGTVTEADKAEGGKFYGNDKFAVGDAYLELQISLKDKSEPKFIYVNVSSLVDTYTAGDGIVVDESTNKISAKLATEGGLKFADLVDGETEKGISLDFETVNIDFSDWT